MISSCKQNKTKKLNYTCQKHPECQTEFRNSSEAHYYRSHSYCEILSNQFKFPKSPFLNKFWLLDWYHSSGSFHMLTSQSSTHGWDILDFASNYVMMVSCLFKEGEEYHIFWIQNEPWWPQLAAKKEQLTLKEGIMWS